MTCIDVALINYQDGGLRKDGGYDFRPLQRAFAVAPAPPALILFCEAKKYADEAGVPMYGAAEALSDELGVPYSVDLGWMQRGPMPPAVFWNPNVLTLRRWWRPGATGAYLDQVNVAKFAVVDSGATAAERAEFLAFVHHLSNVSGDDRLEEARRIGRYGSMQQLPVIGGGDFNSTASGKHLPQRRWEEAPFPSRRHKGMLGPDGKWGPDTRAMDYLIGWWDKETGQRKDGAGLHAVAELAWRDDPSKLIVPTVNEGVDPGGELLIDYLLVNDAMLPSVIPGSYQVHIPDPSAPYPSDHRLVTMQLDLKFCRQPARQLPPEPAGAVTRDTDRPDVNAHPVPTVAAPTARR
ncbi:hypothetical protein [Plantactinospora sp. CA-290183]|uniref:hypothetical protein n=1 Tax=Plantactinospora sp. CA-290183 TaxID=3240006 RepID=UPI003D8B9DF0